MGYDVAMYRPAPGLPGRHWYQRLFSKKARRAASRDFMFDTLPKGGRVIEVGVFYGDFSERILAMNEPRELHLVDPWFPKDDGTLYDGPTQDFKDGKAASEALQAQYLQVTTRFAREIASGRVVLHRTLSHDAAPLFDHFIELIEQYLAGDDYDRRGIWDHGVTRAVDEFRGSGAAETIRLRNHQFLLRKPL